ncbi:hypothetical protein ES703_107585 [subsurface metagenome]
MKYGAGNAFIVLKNIGDLPITTTGIIIVFGDSEARGHYLVVLEPGEDVRMSYGVYGDIFSVPDIREIEVTLKILGCAGRVNSLHEVDKEETLLEKDVTVQVPSDNH